MRPQWALFLRLLLRGLAVGYCVDAEGCKGDTIAIMSSNAVTVSGGEISCRGDEDFVEHYFGCALRVFALVKGFKLGFLIDALVQVIDEAVVFAAG